MSLVVLTGKEYLALQSHPPTYALAPYLVEKQRTHASGKSYVRDQSLRMDKRNEEV